MLRFKKEDGSSYPDWEKLKFKVITIPYKVRNKQCKELEIYSINNQEGFVPQKEQFENAGYLKDTDTSIYMVVPPNHFAYNPARINVGSIGYQNIGYDVQVSSLYEVFRTTDKCNDKFLWYYFHTELFNKMVMKYGEGGVRVYYYYDKLCETPIYLPCLEEQRKIADSLSAIDEKISLHESIVADYEELKKGTMQKIFNQEIRFKDDNREAYPNWKEYRLERLTERVIVGLATSVTPYYREKGTPILRNMNIKKNYLDDSDMLYLDENYAKMQKGKKIKKGDVLTVHTGSNIGLTCMAPDKYVGALSFTTLITTPKPELLDGRFLCQFMNFDTGISRINTLITAGGKPNLNSGDLIHLKIPTPCIEEQKKIADCLSALDMKIAAEKKILEDWKQMKKALLQQMFV